MKRLCIEAACPHVAVHRSRCALHRQSEEQRGYGRDWRRVRAEVRAEVRACERCGTTSDLTVDHERPQSLGGTNERSNLRVLCRRCHGIVGAQSNRGDRGGGVVARNASASPDTLAPFSRCVRVTKRWRFLRSATAMFVVTPFSKYFSLCMGMR